MNTNTSYLFSSRIQFQLLEQSDNNNYKIFSKFQPKQMCKKLIFNYYNNKFIRIVGIENRHQNDKKFIFDYFCPFYRGSLFLFSNPGQLRIVYTFNDLLFFLKTKKIKNTFNVFQFCTSPKLFSVCIKFYFQLCRISKSYLNIDFMIYKLYCFLFLNYLIFWIVFRNCCFFLECIWDRWDSCFSKVLRKIVFLLKGIVGVVFVSCISKLYSERTIYDISGSPSFMPNLVSEIWKF